MKSTVKFRLSVGGRYVGFGYLSDVSIDDLLVVDRYLIHFHVFLPNLYALQENPTLNQLMEKRILLARGLDSDILFRTQGRGFT